MELKFEENGHNYFSIEEPDRKWLSVTTVVGFFKEPFNKEEIAKKCSVKKKSKWYGIPPEKIIETWDKEADRANTLGSWYHAQREDEVSACQTIRRAGIDLPIFRPLKDGNFRLSPDQNLVPGIYPEHFVYLKSANICGQADRVEIIQDTVDIYDYKTYKKVETEAYTSWDGVTKKMYPPIEHLDDCNLMHAALQLSFYMYIILKHNHNLKPGKLIIQHVSFKQDEPDQFGFPKLALDSDNNPIIEKITPYELPYLKSEINAIIKHLKINPIT